MSLLARTVSVTLGAREVLCGVDLAIEPGEVVGLLGPNGGGKTTLLRALAGTQAVRSGQAELDGRSVAAMGELELARARAVLSQATETAFAFTVRDVVLFGRTPHAALETPACRAIAERAITDVGLRDHADVPLGALSGGERQRAHLARVLAQVALSPGSPRTEGELGRYLLLDEPVSELDPAHQHAALALVKGAAASGLGVLVVLHDLNLASQYCDRIALLSGGRVHSSGAPHAVLTKAALAEVFDVDAHVDASPWDAALPRVSVRPRRA